MNLRQLIIASLLNLVLAELVYLPLAVKINNQEPNLWTA